MNCESCVQAEEKGIGWYVKNTAEPLLVLVRKGGIIVESRSGAIRCMANTVGRQVMTLYWL